MELLQLRYFCTVARMQNISHAAAYHQIPQPAMSKTISKLEKELEVPLFHRQNNRIHLTEAGQQFYGRVAMALQELDGALEELQTDHISDSEQLQLLVTALRGKTAEFLSLFRRRYPTVTFQVSGNAGYGDVRDGYDLCITDTQPSPVYDSSLPLVTRQVDVYAAVGRGHPFAQRDSITIEDLKDVPVVAISSSPVLRSITELCLSRGFNPNVVIACDDLNCLQRYIRSGTGIGFTVAYSWPDMGDPQIRYIKLDAQLTQQISAWWSSQAPRSKAWFHLIEQLQQYFNPAAPYWHQDMPSV